MREMRLCTLVLGCWLTVCPNVGLAYHVGTCSFFPGASITGYSNENGGAFANYVEIPYYYSSERYSSIVSSINGVTFSNNNATNYGGAIANYIISKGGGEIPYYAITLRIDNIEDTVFMSNSASSGGAILNDYGASIGSIINTDFSYNSASSGGAIYNRGTINSISGGEFSYNSASSGGAIYNTNKINSIIGTKFTGNKATGANGRGGAIYNSGTNAYIGSINSAVFSYNSATNYGGAIWNGETITTISGGEFNNNSANYGGGAIYNYRTINSISGGEFSNNSASDGGGAILNDYGASIGSIINTDFSYNSANSGGAIYNTNGTIGSITDTDFSYNSATKYYGGAIYNTSSGMIDSITDTDFSYNSASYYGGAILNGGTINSISGGEFSSNSASYGGAIDNDYGASIGSITNTDFSYNSANSGGGAIENDGTITTISGGEFNNNSANYGGAIYNTSSGMIDSITDTDFSYNSANYGGAIYNSEGTINSISGGEFSNNSARNGAGGTIWNVGGTIGSIADTDFSYNSAGNFGGAIVNHGGTISTISGTKFSNNTATNGGAIANTCQFAVIGKIENSEFKYNSAGNFGGAIFIGDDGGYSGNGDGTIGEIKNTTFIGNMTTGGTSSHGAAIYNNSTNDLTLTNVVMKENVATGSGGAIFNNQQSVINLRADAGETVIKDNVSFRDTDWNHDIAIWTKGDVNIDAKNGGLVWLDDSIGTENYNRYGLSVNIGRDAEHSDSTGVVKITGTLWNDVNVNLENATLQLGTNALYNYRGAGDMTTVTFNAISGVVDTAWDNEVKDYELGKLTSSANVKYQIDLSESGADGLKVASATSGSVVTLDSINLLSAKVDGVFQILKGTTENVMLALGEAVKNMTLGDVVKAVMDSTMAVGKVELATTVTENDSIRVGLVDIFKVWADFDTTENKVFTLKNDITLSEDVASVKGKNITIKGDGEERFAIDGNDKKFLSEIKSGQEVELANLELSGVSGNITNKGTLNIDNVKFEGNSVTNGGAIYNGDGASIGSITDTDFSYNSATNYGGAIYNGDGASIGSITNTDFSNNSVTNRYGGAIYNYGTINSISGGEFSNNSARYGGAILNGGLIGAIDNVTFRENVALEEGAAIENRGEINEITNSNFVENKGLVFINLQNGVINAIRDTKFMNNMELEEASTSGLKNVAAFGNMGRVDLMERVEFSGNKVSEENDVNLMDSMAIGGLGILNIGSIGDIKDSTFNDNGGNIVMYGAAISNLKMSNDEVAINNIENTVFERNMALVGSAIANVGGSISTIRGSVFRDNHSVLGGAGVVNMEDGHISSISESVFDNNRALIDGFFDEMPEGFSGEMYGGAIVNMGAYIGEIKNTVFTNNMAGKQGGAIWSDSDLNIVADAGKTLFSGNYVEDPGGNKKAEAVWMSKLDTTITLKAINCGEIRFDDYVDGEGYKVNVTGDETGVVKMYNDLKNADVSVEKVTFDVADKQIEMDSAVFGADSTLSLKVNSLDEHGQVYAKESLTIEDGAKLNATLAQGLVKGKPVEVVLLKSDNAFDDNFAESFDNNMYRFNKKEGSDGVYQIMLAKTAQEVSIENGGSKANGETAKAWIDGERFGEDAKSQEVADKLAELAQTDGKALNDALTSVAPTVAPVSTSVETKALGHVFDLTSKRLDYNHQLGVASGDENKWMMWAQGWYGMAELEDMMEIKDKGVVIGLDKQVTKEVKLGVGYSYASAEAKTDDRTREIEVDSHNVFVYGEYQPSEWFVKGYLGYSFADYEETKEIFGKEYGSKYNMDTMSLQMQVGYDFDLSGTRLSPVVGLRYYHFEVDSYVDGLGQEISSDLADKWSLTAGVEVEKMFTTPHDNTFKVEARANVVYDVEDGEGTTTVSLNNGSRYQISEETIDKFGVEFGADVMYQVGDDVEVGVGYSVELRSDYTEHTGMLTVKYHF